jgi:hypothetical protein
MAYRYIRRHLEIYGNDEVVKNLVYTNLNYGSEEGRDMLRKIFYTTVFCSTIFFAGIQPVFSFEAQAALCRQCIRLTPKSKWCKWVIVPCPISPKPGRPGRPY